MEKNALIELSEALDPGRFCPEGCDHGGGCSRRLGHEGNHQACGSGGKVFCEWTQDGEDVIPAGPKYPDV